MSQYFREGVPHDNKVSQMIAHAYAFDVIVCQSEFEALVLEASQIKAHTPKYNILLKDDKGYSYISVTQEDMAAPFLHAAKGGGRCRVYRPLHLQLCGTADGRDRHGCLPLPRCNKRFPQDIGKGRPCLNAHIGKCMAVCSGKISCETYNQAVKSAVHLIRYGKKDILKILNERMQEASDRLEVRDGGPACGTRSRLSPRSVPGRRWWWTRRWRWTWWRWPARRQRMRGGAALPRRAADGQAGVSVP